MRIQDLYSEIVKRLEKLAETEPRRAYEVYLNGKCCSDFGDIRFSDSTGDNLLDYWIQYNDDIDGDGEGLKLHKLHGYVGKTPTVAEDRKRSRGEYERR